MKLERLRLSATNRPIEVIRYWHQNGQLDLSPPYQRGEVWGLIRKRNLIRSILLGIPIPAIIVNDRFSSSWGDKIVAIDGKQRMTAILGFLAGDFSVPGEWFEMEGMITFPELSLPQQRRFQQTPIPFCEGQLPNLEAEREVFELVNFGGVPQGESDNA
jgi:Protein of unknown function DUF262